MTQTYIFVNTKDYAERIHKKLRNAGFQSYIMFSKMTDDERDQTIERFRNQQINVLITTNIIARGIDVPETQLVINYDVPALRADKGGHTADYETYLHRIGRTGRFGANGIAITLWDREQDKKHLDEIVNHFAMQENFKTLDGPEELKEVLKNLSE